ncbi:hypothetical protein EMEDMD4_1060031 [Sinorhizobium medicae]|uniref:Uncharacterized protein n=1 Tax=Sinorhizobium medicae TaxID=110321 RepID=A0A508WUL5_9HYPH|nr:hypothetical protein EMEDMD4_1060031 [Sinorhizobium medicae]
MLFQPLWATYTGAVPVDQLSRSAFQDAGTRRPSQRRVFVRNSLSLIHETSITDQAKAGNVGAEPRLLSSLMLR